MMNAEQLCKRREKLVLEDEQSWLRHRRDLYDFCMPYRDPKLHDDVSKGPRDTNEIWDATAVVAAARGAGKLQRALTPDYEDWIALVPGPLIPEANRDDWKRELDDVSKIARSLLNQGSFGLAAGEFYLDVYAGEGCLFILKGDQYELMKCQALPPEHVQTIDDSSGRTRAWLYQKDICGDDILRDFPQGKLHPELEKQIKADPYKEHPILQTAERVDGRSFEFKVIDVKRKIEIWRERMRTSPFITPRFFKTPGQRRGAGPPMLAMPTIKTVNKAVEFELKAAAFAILGAWMTTDDGVYNPRTTSLVPGGMLKVAATGGPRGASMARLPIPENFDLSRIMTQELRIQIREMLYDDDLPYEGGPVRSPTEIVERLKRLVQHIAGAFGRLFAELIVPLVQRVLDIADQFGLLRAYPPIDNLLVKAQVISPLANAQALEDVEKAVRLVELLAGMFGPQEAQVQVDPDKYGPYLQEKLGAEVTLLRTPEERDQVRTALRAAAMQAYQDEAAKAARTDIKAVGGGQMKKAA